MSEEEKKAIEILKNKKHWECLAISGKTCLDIALNLITKQQKEIEKANRTIDLMAEYLADKDFDECCAEIPEPCLNCSWEDYEPHTQCIKEYFRKKAQNE